MRSVKARGIKRINSHLFLHVYRTGRHLGEQNQFMRTRKNRSSGGNFPQTLDLSGTHRGSGAMAGDNARAGFREREPMRQTMSPP
ncbi:MAG: hypothetical protein R3F10_06190 [Lysobacteraceae bacterium]